MKIVYNIQDIVPYINWVYFYYAWGVHNQSDVEKYRLRQEAEAALKKVLFLSSASNIRAPISSVSLTSYHLQTYLPHLESLFSPLPSLMASRLTLIPTLMKR